MIDAPKRAKRAAIEQKILQLTKGRYLRLSEIAEALKMSPNTVRAKYLYPMANDGLLEKMYPKRTSVQAYRARR
jgi:Mn-dependent DtxR family transcriptional regulator